MRRRKPARALVASCLALAALAMAGCSAAPGDGPVTLTFQSLYDQPATIALTESIVSQWNSMHPDVQVKIVPAGWDSIYDKLITQFNGRTAPDIIQADATTIVPFAVDGYLADLSPYLSAKTKADISPGVLDSVTVDGKIVAFPTELQTYLVFANKTLLTQAGVAIPTGDTMSWNQLRAIARATTKDGTYGLGWGLSSPTAAFMTMGTEFGGTYFTGTGADAQLKIGPGELALPELVNAMAYQDKSIMPVTLTQSGEATLAPFYAGKIAMTIQGSYQAANIEKDAPEGFDWVVLPPLAGSAGAMQAANPQTLSVNIDSPHVEQAAEFVAYFTDTKNLAALSQADALIPATKSAQQAMASSLAGQSNWQVILGSARYLTSAPYLSADAYAQWEETVATPAFQKYLARQTTATQLSAELMKGWKQANE